MLLLAQTGSVKIGEVVRYTVTYTPSRDRILPTPERLYVRIRNTSNIALRAAFVHGPYTLCVAAYPASYNPNEKFNNPRRYGVPSFEPMIKAGGSWECELVVPDDMRQSAATSISRGGMSVVGTDGTSTSWIIEVSSQVIFSSSAAVGYEILVARDEKSLNLSSATPIVGGQAKVPQPGKLSDHQQHQQHQHHHPAHGVFSRAVNIKVEDTAALWNSPPLPEWDKTEGGVDKQKKVHLVILTHGLHSNLCADMLYMKESIDAAARQAKTDARERKARKRAEREQQKGVRDVDTEPAPATAETRDKPTESHDDDKNDKNDDEHDDDNNDDSDDEEVIVRGYSGNATKTEKGIKYLGKRLARYVLSMTYPDQPFLPLGKGAVEGFKHGLGRHGYEFMQTHKNSTVVEVTNATTNADAKSMSQPKRPYRITSISFIGHSLGGLVQTYAIAYIQKHSPSFFDVIRPINFIALASPFLGLSNENPLYVKFALDFGLVGRTGQDLGLTWRAPTIARSGWGAIVSNLGESAHKKVYGESQPESKPLLRILPTGPAHTALKKFRNRTVYSSVVNDGIVPLRTSCLLFLDWQGLGRVGKARRDAGLVETMVGFGWAELTGANMVSSRQKLQMPRADEAQTDSGMNTPVDESHQVPQPSSDAMAEDDRASLRSFPAAFADEGLPSPPGNGEGSIQTPLSGFFNLFRSNEPPKEQPASEKQKMILRRSQTLKTDETSTTLVSATASEVATATTMTTMMSRTASSTAASTGRATSGQELENDPHGVVMVPPRTTFFESAGDLLNPKIPDVEYLLDPTKRPRTIFHDRVYHPTDIPPPPIKKRTSTLSRMKLKAPSSSSSSQMSLAASGTLSPNPVGAPLERSGMSSSNKDYDEGNEVVDGTNMRVEEKIARGYHRELSWRKVLVKLEPDAHNNIVVRRMFPNAYGWPVMKHLVEAHFSDSAVARMRDEDEHVGERALDMSQPPDEHGAETRTVSSSQMREATMEPQMETGMETGMTDVMEACEALDEVPDLPRMMDGNEISHQRQQQQQQQQLPGLERPDSMSWSEHDWVDSENESEAEAGGDGGSGRLSPGWNWTEKIVGKGATRGRSQSPATSK